MFRPMVVAAAICVSLAGVAHADPTSRDPANVPPGVYALDSRHASLNMKLAHMGGFSNFAMRFDGLSGGFTYDPANVAATRMTLEIDPKSIHTGVPGFDAELAGPRYFDSARFPKITFVSTRVDAGPAGRGSVTGDLTFMGKTRPVTLDVIFNGVGPGLMGQGTRLGFSGGGAIKRSEFGFTPAAGSAGDEVQLDFEIEFTRK
ncbi:YceI family protein [Phenylobacterium sp.]|uniref:YceI family protein n=1 Tax=Phenylobacterium sp. TaxID=1871053 RepID=UPI002735910D|nr:YceI family protein [Phenylobacterium sp.]MDP3658859.1 YceI family protein [Phenylobacterium sp.]